MEEDIITEEELQEELEEEKKEITIDEDERKLKIITEDGEEKEYELIAYIRKDIGEFIVYTDNKQLDNGQILLYVNSVIDDNGVITLDEVEDDEVSTIIDELKERM